MKVINFELHQQDIKVIGSPYIVAGSKNYIFAKFSLKSDDWQKPITAIFGDYTQILDDDNECIVPWEAIQIAGTLKVSAFCGDLHTANTAYIRITETGYKEGETPKEPTPDVYTQLTEMVKSAKETAESIRSDADAGVFDGKDAPQIDDAKITPENPWSSLKIVETFCPRFEVSGNPVTCNPVEGYPLGVRVSFTPIQSGDGDPSPENIRPIIGRDSLQVVHSSDSAASNTYKISVPETVYGGAVDVVTGEGEKTWEFLKLNGTESWSEYTSSSEAIRCFSISIATSAKGIENIISNKFKYVAYVYSTSIAWGCCGNNKATAKYFSVPASEIQDADSWKSYLAAQAAAGTPVTIAFQIAAPKSFSVDPRPISSLPGVNTIYTDADSTIVSGRSDPIAYVQQKISDAISQSAQDDGQKGAP